MERPGWETGQECFGVRKVLSVLSSPSRSSREFRVSVSGDRESYTRGTRRTRSGPTPEVVDGSGSVSSPFLFPGLSDQSLGSIWGRVDSLEFVRRVTGV